MDKYKESLKRIENEKNDADEFYDIQKFFETNKVKIVKMNHCLNDQGSTQYEGYMKLEDEGEYMKITNKIPNPKYQVTQNSKELKNMQRQYKEQSEAKF